EMAARQSSPSVGGDMIAPRRTLVIACGALAREFLAVVEANGWTHLEITCLPAIWHNHPEKIPEGGRRKIRAGRRKYDGILYLQQVPDPVLESKAQAAADRLGLRLEVRHTGLSQVERFLARRNEAAAG